jgi:hypothetical protein
MSGAQHTKFLFNVSVNSIQMSLHCLPCVIDAKDGYSRGVVGGDQQSVRNVSTLLPVACIDFLRSCESRVS